MNNSMSALRSRPSVEEIELSDLVQSLLSRSLAPRNNDDMRSRNHLNQSLLKRAEELLATVKRQINTY
jgi:hypothetical protein